MKILGYHPTRKGDDCCRLEELRSVRIFCYKQQLSHTPVLHGCRAQESDHGLQFSEDVIHKGTVNQTRTPCRISPYKPNVLPAEGRCQTREGNLKSVCPDFRTMRSQPIFKSKKCSACMCFCIYQRTSFYPYNQSSVLIQGFSTSISRYLYLFSFNLPKRKKKNLSLSLSLTL